MTTLNRRMAREQKTVAIMITLYCRDHHGASAGRCPECADLVDYAWQRLFKCPFQEGKTSCTHCSVHCYRPDMRAKVRTVMRYSGPRMLTRHPILAIMHMIDGMRKEPVGSKGRDSSRA